MRPTNFDPVARIYRWAEYLTLGRSLERCRLHYLPQLRHCTRALVLGDGDGRFLAQLLLRNNSLTADAVDSSDAMLARLQSRAKLAKASGRVALHHADAMRFDPPASDYDLVATHFFLDCFTDDELAILVPRIADHAVNGALWIFSDFNVPGPGAIEFSAKTAAQIVARVMASAIVRSLYFAFRLLTGLRSTHLPDHAAALTSAGFRRLGQHLSLYGLLTTELWQKL